MRDFVKYKIKANHIFISGLLVIPPFIFQQSTAVKWGQVFLFVLSAYLTGKKIRVIPNIIMISGIIFANLLTPVGEVLFEYGWFIITGAALKSGLEKSALLIGMIYLSKFTLSGGFSSPGNKSNILSLVFYYFEKIMEGERSLNKTNFKRIRLNNISFERLIELIDAEITAVSEKNETMENQSVQDIQIAEIPSKSSFKGIAVLASFVLLNWLLFVLNHNLL